MPKVRIRDLLAKKEVEPGKKIDLEKNDFLALVIACVSVFLPALLFVCFLVFLFIWGWVTFFG